MIKKIFDFIIFSSLFIAICAALMVLQTYLLFDLSPSIRLILFVFSGAVCSYNFHWFLTPPVDSPFLKNRLSIHPKKIHLSLSIVGAIGAAICAVLSIEHWFWLGIAGLLTFLYSAPKVPHPTLIWLRQIAVGKTIFLAFAWTLITALLPLLFYTDSLTPHQIIFAINRFFFIYPICIIFDKRDVEEDRKNGIKSLVTILNDKGLDILFWGSIITCVITTALLAAYFAFSIILIVLIPVIVLGAMYPYTKGKSSDYLYYLVLDGLMMLSAPLLILYKFAR